jgi:lipoprotein signal peptidase
MARSFTFLAATAAGVAAIDLAYKAWAGPVFIHERSALYGVGIGLVCLAWAAAILLLRSPAIAVAAGPLVGGAAGNGLSLALWPGVPNPLVVDGLAFNLADVSVGVGLLLLLPAVLVFAARNRDRLFEPFKG